MAKSKFSPALFEVIRTRQDPTEGGKLPVPKWWKRESQTSADGSEGTEEAIDSSSLSQEQQADASAGPQVESTAFVEPPMTTVIRPRSASVSPVLRDDHDSPPAMRVGDGRIALSLNPMIATVVAGSLLVTLFAAYELGHHSGYKAARNAPVAAAGSDEVDRLVNGTAKPDVLKATPAQAKSRSNRDRENPPARVVVTPTESGAKNVSPPATPAAAKPAITRHVLLETFRASDKESAEFAQKWLAKNKQMETSVETRGDHSIVLVSADNFDYSKAGDEQRAKQYCETVKSLGKTIGKEMARAGLKNYLFSSPQVRAEK